MRSSIVIASQASDVALRERCERLEHELSELRAQVARRLDEAAAEVQQSRQMAEMATAQVQALRVELANVVGEVPRHWQLSQMA